MTSRIAAAVAAVAALAAWLAAPASAGTYTVYSCKTPTGAVAPTDGWSLATANVEEAANDCASGGALRLRSPARNSRVGWATGMQYSASAGTTFERLTVWRSVVSNHSVFETANNHWASWLGVGTAGYADKWDTCDLGCTVQGSAADPVGAANAVTSPPLVGAREAFVMAGCVGRAEAVCDAINDAEGEEPRSGFVRLAVHGVAAELRDDAAPAVADVDGTLALDGKHAGIEELAFSATDEGAGLYKTVLQTQAPGAAGWDTRVEQLVDRNEGRCVELDARADTDLEFGYRVPCALAAAQTVAFDTTTLPDGVHRLRVLVRDAAGNTTAALPARAFEVDNVPPPAATRVPSITGSARVGATLTGAAGTWTGQDLAFGWQWARCTGPEVTTCAAIAGATDETYRLTEDDLDHRIRVTVTASNREGSTLAQSEAVGPVVTPPPPTTPAGGVTTPTPTATVSPAPTAGASGDDRKPGGGPAGAVNGVNASRGARLTASGPAVRRLRFRRTGRTRLTLRDEAGRPITGAAIVVLQRLAVPGARFVAAHPAVRTDDDGRINYLISPGPSRTLRFAYAPEVGGVPVAIRELSIRVPSRTSLATNRSFLRNGQTVRFKGRLLAGPVPSRGVPVDLQARVGRRWQTFQSLRTRADGRWRSRYTFRATRGLQTYAFRARVRGDSAFPYAPSTSRTVKVRVRG